MMYNTVDLNSELCTLQIAYRNLQNTYSMGDRNQTNREYNSAMSLPIPGIKQCVWVETQKLLYLANPNAKILSTPIDRLPIDQLEYNIQGCLNAIQNEINLRELYLNNNSFTQRMIYQPCHTFKSSDVLNSNQNGVLKVADLLSVLKYTSSLAEAIEPKNEDYARATATITVCQAIDAVLNNKPDDKPINKLMHLMASFLCTTVKSSLNDYKAKQGVTISSIIVDLAIDFFCKK